MSVRPGSRLLVDSSFLFALFYPRDKSHADALKFARNNTAQIVVPEVILPEVAYLFSRARGLPAVLAFMDAFGNLPASLECLNRDDFRRARAVMAQHADAQLDFVDCALVALAERLNITRVCTFDRRDFAMIQPAHAKYLELLP